MNKEQFKEEMIKNGFNSKTVTAIVNVLNTREDEDRYDVMLRDFLSSKRGGNRA